MKLWKAIKNAVDFWSAADIGTLRRIIAEAPSTDERTLQRAQSGEWWQGFQVRQAKARELEEIRRYNAEVEAKKRAKEAKKRAKS